MQYEMARVQAREQQDHQQRIVQLEAQRIQNEQDIFKTEKLLLRERDEHLSQEAEQFRRQQEAQADAVHRKQEERDHLEAAAYDQARAAENAARIAQEAAELLLRYRLRLMHKHRCRTAQAAAQAGQLDQYFEALRQQNLPPGRKAYQEPLGHHSLGPMNVKCQHAMLFTGC